MGLSLDGLHQSFETAIEQYKEKKHRADDDVYKHLFLKIEKVNKKKDGGYTVTIKNKTWRNYLPRKLSKQYDLVNNVEQIIAALKACDSDKKETICTDVLKILQAEINSYTGKSGRKARRQLKKLEAIKGKIDELVPLAQRVQSLGPSNVTTRHRETFSTPHQSPPLVQWVEASPIPGYISDIDLNIIPSNPPPTTTTVKRLETLYNKMLSAIDTRSHSWVSAYQFGCLEEVRRVLAQAQKGEIELQAEYEARVMQLFNGAQFVESFEASQKVWNDKKSDLKVALQELERLNIFPGMAKEIKTRLEEGDRKLKEIEEALHTLEESKNSIQELGCCSVAVLLLQDRTQLQEKQNACSTLLALTQEVQIRPEELIQWISATYSSCCTQKMEQLNTLLGVLDQFPREETTGATQLAVDKLLDEIRVYQGLIGNRSQFSDDEKTQIEYAEGRLLEVLVKLAEALSAEEQTVISLREQPFGKDSCTIIETLLTARGKQNEGLEAPPPPPPPGMLEAPPQPPPPGMLEGAMPEETSVPDTSALQKEIECAWRTRRIRAEMQKLKQLVATGALSDAQKEELHNAIIAICREMASSTVDPEEGILPSLEEILINQGGKSAAVSEVIHGAFVQFIESEPLGAVVKDDLALFYESNDIHRNAITGLATKLQFNKPESWPCFEKVKDKIAQGTPKQIELAVDELALILKMRPGRVEKLFHQLINVLDDRTITRNKRVILSKYIGEGLREHINKPGNGSLKDDCIACMDLFLIAYAGERTKKDCLTQFQDHLGITQERQANNPDGPSHDYVVLFNPSPEAAEAAVQNFGIDSIGFVKLAVAMALKKLPSNQSVRPLFLGTEWRFIAKNAAEFTQLLDSLAELSASYPNVLFIPGSIGWGTYVDPSDPHSAFICFNSLPVFSGGRLLNLYHKKHEAMDMNTVASIAHVQRDRCKWATNIPEFRDAINEYNTAFFFDNGLLCGTEICNDHASGAAQREYKDRFPQGEGNDLQVVMAHGTRPQPQRVPVRQNGGFAYMDHSSSKIGAEVSFSTISSMEGGGRKQTPLLQQTNNNKGLVGAFKIAPTPPTEISPEHVTFPEKLKLDGKGTGHMALFEVLGGQVGKTQEEMRQLLVEHLTARKQEFYPEGELVVPTKWTPHAMQTFLLSTKKRYTFANKREVDKAIDDLSNDKSNPRLDTVLLQLVSEALGREIVVIEDLASAPIITISPEWKTLTQATESPLFIAFSQETGTFSSVHYTDEDLSAYQALCTEHDRAWYANTSTDRKAVLQTEADSEKKYLQSTERSIKAKSLEKAIEVHIFRGIVLGREQQIHAQNTVDLLMGFQEGYFSYLDVNEQGNLVISPFALTADLEKVYAVIERSITVLFFDYPTKDEKFKKLIHSRAEQVCTVLERIKKSYSSSMWPSTNYTTFCKKVGALFDKLHQITDPT